MDDKVIGQKDFAYRRELAARLKEARLRFIERVGVCADCSSTKELRVRYLNTARTNAYSISFWNKPFKDLCALVVVLCHQCLHRRRGKALMTKLRARKMGQDGTLHGIYYYTRMGCRCVVCLKANREQHLRYYHRRAKLKKKQSVKFEELVCR